MELEEEVDYELDQPEAPAEEQGPAEDIYGDLYDEHGEAGALLNAKYAALEEKCKGLEANLATKNRENLELTQERDKLLEEKRILIRNISCLYRTAKEDLDRMNQVISQKNEQILYMELKKRSPEKAALMRNPVDQPLAQPVGGLMPSNPKFNTR